MMNDRTLEFTNDNAEDSICKFLINACLEFYEGGHCDELARLAALPGFSWGELIEQAVRNKIFPLVAHLMRQNVALNEQAPYHTIRPFIYDALRMHHYVSRQLVEQMSVVVETLTESKIPFVLRKGASLDQLIYGDRQLRKYGDIDFLTRPEDFSHVTGLLNGLGFRQGTYNEFTDNVRDLTRRERITYRLNPDHLPRFAKLLEDELIRFCEVDVALSLTWTNSPFQIPIEPALSSRKFIRVESCSSIVPVLDADYQFLDTTLHFFREAYLESAINSGNDVDLSKCLDILMLWHVHRTSLESEQFQEMLRNYGLAQPVAWVTKHVDQVFGTNITNSLQLSDLVQPEFLRSYRADGGTIRQWSGDMKARLFDRQRKANMLGYVTDKLGGK